MQRSTADPLPSAAARTLALGAALAIVTSLAAGVCAATTYKWTDANGHVVYSDQPPPGDIKSELVGPAPPPANPHAAKDMAQKSLDLDKRQKDRAAADAKADKDREQDTRRRDLCLVVRGKLNDMRAGMPVYKYDSSGARVFLNDDERKAEMDRQLEAEKKYCGTSG
jgi:Domain of unknown function (DUF4124)